MAISTYAELQSAIASWLNRADLTAQITDFITLAEARFNRELRTRDMEERNTLSVSSGTVTLDPDWLETIQLSMLNARGKETALEFVSPVEFSALSAVGPTGATHVYSIIGGSIYLLPAPSAATTFYHHQRVKVPALSNSNTSNWLLARSPDLYLYGSLMAAEPYLMNDERLPVWTALSTSIIDNMNTESDKSRQSRGALNTRRRTFG